MASRCLQQGAATTRSAVHAATERCLRRQLPSSAGALQRIWTPFLRQYHNEVTRPAVDASVGGRLPTPTTAKAAGRPSHSVTPPVQYHPPTTSTSPVWGRYGMDTRRPVSLCATIPSVSTPHSLHSLRCVTTSATPQSDSAGTTVRSATPPQTEDMGQIHADIIKHLCSDSKPLEQATHYYFDGAGKMVRV